MNEDYILITGGSGSIGRALSAKFLSEGFHVISLDMGVPLGKGLKAETFLRCDLREIVNSSVAADGLLGEIKRIVVGGKLKALINNAAVQLLAPVASVTRDQWSETLDVNVGAAFFMTQLMLPELSGSGGSVVNIGSIHSRLTKPGFAAYAASKAALAGLTRAMAVDLRGSVAVNCIEPAAIDTMMLREGFRDNNDGFAELASFHPSGRIGSPAEIAELAYILAVKPGFLNGSVLSIDGGISGRLHDPV